jgi:choline dehydrogenase-like flavoprotein
MAENYDVVIAGGGTVGCILAARIAERGKNPRTGERLRVAMVEAGPYLKGDPEWGLGAESRRSEITHVTVEDVGRWNWSGWGETTAKIVGGSSVHFGSNAWLPRPEDFVAWTNASEVTWTYEGWREALQEAQEMFHIHPTPPFAMSKGTLLFRKAAESLGHTVEPCPRAAKNCIYCGYCGGGYSCRYDSKVSSLLAFVPIAERNGVEIIPDAEIARILIDKTAGGKPVAKGIVYRRQGNDETLEAGKIIVSCGIIGTPRLLMKSGYGPAAMLGSNLVVRNDNIGRHVTGDTSASLFATFKDDIMETQFGASGACHFTLQDEDPDGLLRLRIKDSFMNRISFPWQEAFSELSPDFGWEHKKFMEEVALTKIGGVRASVQNTVDYEGHVDPEGRIRYEGDASKIEKRKVEGLEIIHEILKKMNPVKISSIPNNVRVGRLGHQLGSCRAGRDRGTSVITSDFESHDIENLLICDNSALPKHGVSLSAGPAMAVGCYGWRRIVANYFS